MANDAMLQVRIDSKLKSEAEQIFESLGITLADAVRIFAVQAVKEQGFPFEVKTGFKQTRTLHAAGLASRFADVSKIPFEKDAWAMAVREKYEAD